MPEHHDDDLPPQGPPSQTRLFALVTQYQQLRIACDQTSNPVQRAQCNDRLQAVGLELWLLLEQPLMGKVGRRVRGALSDMLNNPASYPSYHAAVEALAMNCMLGLLDALPRLRLDPARNIQAYLTKIAWFGLLDEERAIYTDVQRGSRGRTILVLRLDQVLCALNEAEDATSLTDRFKDEQAAQAFERITGQQLLDAVSRFWQEELSPVDQQIVRLRLQEPPVSYAQIVSQLGEGWTATAARQRFGRAMKQTRAFLHAHGWI